MIQYPYKKYTYSMLYPQIEGQQKDILRLPANKKYYLTIPKFKTDLGKFNFRTQVQLMGKVVTRLAPKSESLVQWSWEETCDLQVMSLNSFGRYQKYIVRVVFLKVAQLFKVTKMKKAGNGTYLFKMLHKLRKRAFQCQPLDAVEQNII